MKNVMFGLMVVLSLIFVSDVCWADETPKPETSSTTSPISKEDAAKLRVVLDQLGKVDGEKPAEKTSDEKKTEEEKPETPSMAKVADKALDMLGASVAAVSQNLQKVAPEVWRIMIRQQYAKAIFGVLTPALFFVFFLICSLILWKKWPKKSFDDMTEDEKVAFIIVRHLIPWATLIVSAATLFCNVGNSIKLVINPEYYAVKDILTLITNPSKAEE